MNRREKFLIVLLAAVIILLGGFKLLIEPKMKKIAEAKTGLEQAQMLKQKIEGYSRQKAGIEKQIKALESSVVQESVRFLPELSTDSVHIFFQDMAERANVRYDSFTMTSKTTAQIKEHDIVNTELSYPAKDAVEGIDRIDNKNPADKSGQQDEKSSRGSQNKQPADIIEMMVVSLQFKGTDKENIYKKSLDLIDRINKSKRMVRISSLDMTMNDRNELVISITAECFGIVKMNPDSLSDRVLPKDSGKTDPFYG